MDKKILEKIIAYNTVSDKSNLELVNFVEQKAKDLGYQTKTYQRGDKANLFINKPTKKPRVILSSHSDTVPYSSSWKYDPLQLTEHNGKLIGLGISDMKVNIAISLAALEKYSDSDNLAMLLTFDEETDFSGVNVLNKTIIRPKDTIILGEPTNNRAVFASKGATGFEITFLGKGGHGSEPKKGKSAILESKRFIHVFEDEFDKLAEKYYSAEFANPHPTFNIGHMSGGDAINKIPEKCKMLLEIRYMTENQLVNISKLLEDTLRALNIKYKIKKSIQIESFSASKDIRKAFKQAKIPNSLGLSGATEASIMQKITENIAIFGAGDFRQAHKVYEFVSVRSIEKYEESLDRLLKTLL